MQDARRAEVEITYEGKNITTPVDQYLESFTYTDIASGESDRIQMDLHDIRKEWMDAWMPSKGDRISGAVVLHNWMADGETQRIYCGEFELDEMSFSGRPLKCGFGAVSIPRNEPFNVQKRAKTWEGITIRQIAEEIAGRAGISLYYEADDIGIEIIEQNEETDCKFLYSVCADYGLAMKVYASRIIIFDEETYEGRKSVRNVDETDMEGWDYQSTMAGTYTGAAVRFSDPNNEEEYEVIIGGGSRILEINENADSIEDAERKGIAKLNNENKKAVTMKITMMADPVLAASSCIDIMGMGEKINGKYYIDKVTTKKSGSGECKMNLELHRVVPRIKSASIGAVKQADAEALSEGKSYTVVQGDTLWGIAKHFYGSGMEYTSIYERNREKIEGTAKERGKKDSSQGHWIFPGTVLEIPPRKGEE